MSSERAPATIVSPSMATDVPSRSPTAAVDEVSLAVWLQASPTRVKTNTAPRPPSASGAPTTAVSPSTADDWPVRSFAAPPAPISRCSSAAAGAASTRRSGTTVKAASSRTTSIVTRQAASE